MKVNTTLTDRISCKQLQILETQSAVLTNAEVLAHLQDVHTRYTGNPDYRNHKDARLKGLESVSREVNPLSF